MDYHENQRRRGTDGILAKGRIRAVRPPKVKLFEKCKRFYRTVRISESTF